MHGDSALYVARTYYKTTAVIKHLGGAASGVPSVTLNLNLFQTVLRDLLLERADRTVEMWECAGSSWKLARLVHCSCRTTRWNSCCLRRMPCSTSGFVSVHICDRSASPGRLAAFDEELFSGGKELSDAPVVVAGVVVATWRDWPTSQARHDASTHTPAYTTTFISTAKHSMLATKLLLYCCVLALARISLPRMC